MTTPIEHIKSNLIGYALPIVAMLMWGGFTAFMDQRHDEKGASEVVKTSIMSGMDRLEVKQLKREKRKLLSYERTDPGSKYSLARQQEIDALTDEIEGLEDD